MQYLMNFSEMVLRYAKTVSISDLIDILIVTYLIYRGMKLLKDTVAARLAKGILVLACVTLVADQVLHLNTISYVLKLLFTYGVTAALIIFQPELRRMLEQLGKGSMTKLLIGREEVETPLESAIAAIVSACAGMSATKTGALIVCEREETLGEIAKTGTRINAEPSVELIKNIFYPKSPLHDGAMVVRRGRVLAAGCVLPLSGSQNLSRDLGTRHRAAVGMSESSDSVLVVVSEETGDISVAIGGMLKRRLSPELLRKVLVSELIEEPKETRKKGMLDKWKGKKK